MPHDEDSSAISNGACERQTEDALAMLQESANFRCATPGRGALFVRVSQANRCRDPSESVKHPIA